MKQVAQFLTLCLLVSTVLTCRGQVVISEFMADNKNALADEDGDYSDWVELYNTAATNVNLNNWSLADDNNRWYFPATNLTAKGYLVVFASGKDRRVPGAPLHADFSLRASGEYLGLLTPAGIVASEFSPAFPAQEPDVSCGLEQRGVTNKLVSAGASARVLVPTNNTLASTWTTRTFNDAWWPTTTTGMGFQTAVAGFAVSNYLAAVQVTSYAGALGVITNTAQQLAVYAANAPVINFLNFSAVGAHFPGDTAFPGLNLTTDRNDFVINATATVYIPAAGNWTFGVNSDDGFSLSVGAFNMAHPTTRGSADTLQTFNFAAPGNYPIRLVYFERSGAGQVELWAAQGSYTAFNTSFRLVGDTVNGGLQVTAPPVSGGSGALSYLPLIGTNLQAQMSGARASAYLRVPFNVTNVSALQSLTFRIKYDDGFALWMNGQPVASRNAPASPAWNSAATASHANDLALKYEEINLSDQIGILVNGVNLLAIQGLNVTTNDPDFLIVPEAVEYRITNGPAKYFSGPTPGSINAGGAAAFVGDTKFSVDRGFFDTPFSLVITSATPSATIIYTTNGSVPTLVNGFVHSGPLLISGTTVIRAAAFRDGYLPSDVDTQTYLFLNDVIRQSPDGLPPPGWPASWGANVVNYGMDPDVVNNPLYSAEIIEDLKSIPTFSVVTELGNLFNATTGIYANPSQEGIAWERPASVELIHPSGADGFQINCGLRVRGGFSRSTNNPKHAFRLLFRSEYGDAKLNYPVFAKHGGAEEFDGFDLRTFQNYSWSFLGDYRFTGLRDQFSRDTQVAQGQLAERGDYYHLYINGQYWGIYNTAERAEASFSESYIGGAKEDYDVVKVENGVTSTTDGNIDAWRRLWQAATNGFAADLDYFKVQGLNADGTRNPAFENLVDVDNLIDYMLLIFLTGNIDAPITQFGNNGNPNNYYAVRNRTGLFGGFRFLAHDAEHTLLFESSLSSDNQNELYRDRTGPFPAGDPILQGAANAFQRSNPGYFFSRLSDNAEFRLRVADRVQKYFFNGGLFTTEAMRSRFLVRSNEIYGAVVAESARWGDSKRAANPFTRDVEWVAEMTRLYDTWFAFRPGIVLSQLQAKNLFPYVSAPDFNQFGGVVTNGFEVSLSAPAGVIYYTRDGSDPRLRGDAVSQKAAVYDNPITLEQSTTFKARVLSDGIWSALTECTFYIQRDFSELLVTEVMYHPPDTVTQDGDAFEFIELKNVARTSLDLSGISFTNGITFQFPVGTVLAPGQFIVLVSDPAGFTNKYPGILVGGVYQGRLSNSGERLTLVHVTGVPIATFEYGTRSPWPLTPDGSGFSLVPGDPNLNPDPANPLNWRASNGIGGSPGADDPPSDIPRVVINEVLTHTDPPQLDTLELYNPYPTNVSVGGWYLTDERTVPRKYRIPADRQIPGYGYLLFTENDWNADPQATNSFRLDSHGESLYLFSADTNGTLTGYSEGLSFGAARNGVSFGRYTNSVGEVQFPAQLVNTLPGANSGPRVGPVVISEIHYNPAPGGDEFVELKNITTQMVRLYDPSFPTNTWRLNGIGFHFPANVQLAADGVALVVGIDPAVFRTKYGVPGNVPVFGPYAGSLQGGGESLALQFPDQPDLQDGTVFVPYIDVDVVRYDNRSPWPTQPDGNGPSLERLNDAVYGNDPINWRASPSIPSPGVKNTAGRPPLVNAGPDRVLNASNAPFAFALAGTALDDGTPGPLQVSWSFVSGPAPVWFENDAQPATTAYFPGVGVYTLRLTADDGGTQSSDEVTLTVRHPKPVLTLVAKGSVWKYLDNGSDQGTAWRARLFDDRLWLSGRAPLGYDDADGQWPATTNSFGSDPNSKHLTYYYRHAFSVTNPASMTNLVLSVQRDDGVVVYLNGTGIFTNNMPTNVPITYLTNALSVVSGAAETTFYSQLVDLSLLLAGTNVLAVELHQSSRTSTDIIFDCSLTAEGYPLNAGPAVFAGADLNVVFPANASLSAAVADDGLPVPPGLLSSTWSKISGPGTVTFGSPGSPKTTAGFSQEGAYVLRFTASDGTASAIDDVNVNVFAQPLRITSATVTKNPSLFRLQFPASAGFAYRVQYSSSLTSGAWTTLTNVPAQAQPQTIEVIDPAITSSSPRFYRVVAP